MPSVFRRHGVPPLLVLCLSLLSCRPADDGQRSPEAALAAFEVAPGFQVEAFAAEPLLADPVAMEIDESGRLFVLEMPGYPLDVSPSGRVVLLDDTDGDGLPDRRRIFADDLVLPTGLMRWRQGLLVTAPPEVIYLEDTDGDGEADRREVVLSGFARSNPQHNFNKPYFGLDNWIYLANNGTIGTDDYADLFGDPGSEVYFPAAPDAGRLGRNAEHRNVRFKPDTHALESLSSRSQFGHAFDDWGHHFSLNNARPQFHEVIANRYLTRNPLLPIQAAMQYTPAYGQNTAIYPITDTPEHQLLTDRGMITSAAGLTLYQGGLFPDDFHHVSFVGEPVHNLVHALRTVEDGPTFRAERLRERAEFLASRDSWFRPVNFYIGPDGALYVVDYYRQIVEHPEWMDDATRASGNLYNGNDRGRIYRIVPEGGAGADWMGALDLAALSSDELTTHLAHPNIWWRRNAQRILLDRGDAGAEGALIAMANGTDAVGRLHALWTLEGLGLLTDAQIRDALTDDIPGIRENAIVLAESRIATTPSLLADLAGMENDPHARVRFQLLCTLGFHDTPQSRAVRQRMLTREIEDPWMQIAALSAPDRVDELYLNQALAVVGRTVSEGRQMYVQRIGQLLGAQRDADLFAALVRRFTENGQRDAAWQRVALIRGLAEGTPRNEAYPAASAAPVLAAFTASRSTEHRGALLSLLERTGLSDAAEAAVQASASMAADARVAPELRAQAIQLLAMHNPDGHEALLKERIVPAEQPMVQQASVRAMRTMKGETVADFLIGRWAALTPAVRDDALDVLMRTPERVARLLDAVEDGTIQRSSLGWNRTVVLMRDWDGPLRDRARALLSEQPGERERVVETYMASLSASGDIEAGKAAFQQVCGACHQVAGEYGQPFGPDLATVRHWSPEALVAKILMPQRSLADGYEVWTVERTSGETATGLIASESPTSITLRTPAFDEVTIARNDIASIQNTNQTLMPTGLEAALDQQQMVDLIAFLRYN